MPAAWAARNWRHVGPDRLGADAELDELAVDPSVSPQRTLPRQADDETGDAAMSRRVSGLAPLARIVLPGHQLPVPGQQCRGRHGQDHGPAFSRHQPRQRGGPGRISWLVPHPAGLAPQDRVLIPQHQLRILGQVAAEHQDIQTEHTAHEHVDNPEQHPAS
jgi:hypothetical protein